MNPSDSSQEPDMSSNEVVVSGAAQTPKLSLVKGLIVYAVAVAVIGSLSWIAVNAQSNSPYVDIRINGSNSPAPVLVGNNFTISWTSSGVSPNGRCYRPVTTNSWPLPPNSSGSGSVTATATSAGNKIFGIFCSNNSGQYPPGNPDTQCNQSGICDLIQLTVNNPPAPPTPPSNGGGSNSPPPSTSPPSTPPPSSGGGSGGGGSGGSSGGSPSPRVTTTPKATPSTAAPTAAPVLATKPNAPTNFGAVSGQGETSVRLSWSAPANVALGSYQLERSDVQTTWQVLTDSLKETSYADASVNFNSQYSYRLLAIDSRGNKSDYVHADVTTTSFIPNAGPDQTTELVSEDQLVKITIPPGAVDQVLACSLENTFDLASTPEKDGYELAVGPYEVICKDAQSNIIISFHKPLPVNVSVVALKNYTETAFYTLNIAAEGWDSLANPTVNPDTNTYDFTLENGNAFVILGKPKSTPKWLIALIIITIITIILVTIGLIIRLINKHHLESEYDDYYKKSYGL